MDLQKSTQSSVFRSPARILGLMLGVVFVVEAAVMVMLPFLVPDSLGETTRAMVDAFLLTSICAPLLWWVIVGPLRRIAIQEHQRSETIVANASESILTFDRDGNILSHNRAASTLFGVPDDSWHRRHLRTVIPEFPEELGRLPQDLRFFGIRSDSKQFPVQVSISEYPSESMRMYIAIIRDLTWSERAEQANIEAVREKEALRTQQMATLAQLATGVAHEIRNPLTSIKMLIQVNRSKFAKEGLPTDDLELVEGEIRRMERSVNSLLEYARPERSEFCEVDLSHVIQRTHQLIVGRSQSQNVIVSIQQPSHAIRLNVDPAQIHQLLLNLCLNALDEMPSGGELTLSVREHENSAEVAVRDTGNGIDEGMMEKLFTPFVTTKPGGVGLGLGICRRIAESHQGTLVASNNSDRGASFVLTLPLIAKSASADKSQTDRLSSPSAVPPDRSPLSEYS
ncbi:MAG: ATP-binding protein [Planctomycetota bacterium]|jgi:PAS domain S-box-containing protein|nr:ATP-binding protein [Planctomycetota bacterium]